MGLLSKLKSLLGMEKESRSAGSGVDVTVEHEPSTESEEAVTEPAAESAGGADEPVATETDAAASTESLADEEHTDDPTSAAEPAEAGVTDDGQAEADVEDDVDTGADTEAGSTESGSTESVSTVKGIGPAYANRLEDAGVQTVADLAAVEPEELAERVDLSPKRVGRWVDRANDSD